MNLPRLLFRLLLGRRLPTTAGMLTAPGIRQPVVIKRDRYGIAHATLQVEGAGSDGCHDLSW